MLTWLSGQRPGSYQPRGNAQYFERVSSSHGRGLAGFLPGQKILIGKRYACLEIDRGPPTQGEKPGAVQELSWRAIRFRWVPNDLSLITDNTLHDFRQLVDRQI